MFKFDSEIAAKLAEPKSYIRINSDGEPQLLMVYPLMSELGIVDHDHVAVFLDEDGPHTVPKDSLAAMLRASDCVPLEEVTHFKVRVH